MSSAPAAPANEDRVVSSRDVEGVPSSQLKKVFEDNADADLTAIATRIGIDLSYLKRIVVEPITPVVKLGMADKILVALGLNITELINDGSLTIVPLRYNYDAAQRIVDEEIAFAEDLDLPVPTEAEIEARLTELLDGFAEHCEVTPEQQGVRERTEAQRKKRRR